MSIFKYIIILLIFNISACQNNSSIEISSFSGKTMGTQYHINIASSNLSASALKQLHQKVDQLLFEINSQMSTYQVDSEINAFNSFLSDDWFTVSQELFEVVETAQNISRETNGYFDITIQPLIEAWGFGTESVLKIPNSEVLSEIQENVGFKYLKLKESPTSFQKSKKLLKIDVSAIAKGYAVDKVSELLLSEGFQNHLVEIGGELKAKGLNANGKRWKVLIKHPKKNSKEIQSLRLSNKAV
ncbi:MAG: FAD:protein FMN transferase, partial [Putridiphycobacter sp.]